MLVYSSSIIITIIETDTQCLKDEQTDLFFTQSPFAIDEVEQTVNRSGENCLLAIPILLVVDIATDMSAVLHVTGTGIVRHISILIVAFRYTPRISCAYNDDYNKGIVSIVKARRREMESEEYIYIYIYIERAGSREEGRG